MGLLDQGEFNFTTLVGSNSPKNPLPQAILVQGHVLGKNLNFRLNQITSKMSLTRPQVYQKSNIVQRNNKTWTVNPRSSQNLVRLLVFK